MKIRDMTKDENRKHNGNIETQNNEMQQTGKQNTKKTKQ